MIERSAIHYLRQAGCLALLVALLACPGDAAAQSIFIDYVIRGLVVVPVDEGVYELTVEHMIAYGPEHDGSPVLIRLTDGEGNFLAEELVFGEDTAVCCADNLDCGDGSSYRCDYTHPDCTLPMERVCSLTRRSSWEIDLPPGFSIDAVADFEGDPIQTGFNAHLNDRLSTVGEPGTFRNFTISQVSLEQSGGTWDMHYELQYVRSPGELTAPLLVRVIDAAGDVVGEAVHLVNPDYRTSGECCDDDNPCSQPPGEICFCPDPGLPCPEPPPARSCFCASTGRIESMTLSPGDLTVVVDPEGLHTELDDPDGADNATVITITTDVADEASQPATRPRVELRPNPTRGHVTIDYAGEHDSVVAEIVDVSGRIVRTLDTRGATAGANTFEWDGRTSAGVRVTSGIYFVRMTAGSNVSVTRLVVIR